MRLLLVLVLLSLAGVADAQGKRKSGLQPGAPTTSQPQVAPAAPPAGEGKLSGVGAVGDLPTALTNAECTKLGGVINSSEKACTDAGQFTCKTAGGSACIDNK